MAMLFLRRGQTFFITESCAVQSLRLPCLCFLCVAPLHCLQRKQPFGLQILPWLHESVRVQECSEHAQD